MDDSLDSAHTRPNINKDDSTSINNVKSTTAVPYSHAALRPDQGWGTAIWRGSGVGENVELYGIIWRSVFYFICSYAGDSVVFGCDQQEADVDEQFVVVKGSGISRMHCRLSHDVETGRVRLYDLR